MRPRVVAAALLGVLGAALLAPGLATAHAELVSSTPAANASLRESPAAVTMTFSEPIDPATASVHLLDQLQQAVTGVGAVQVDATGLVASVDVPKLDPGVYTVSYRVTSATDGHVTAGIWAFLVDPTGSQPPPAIAAHSDSPSGDALTVSTRWLSLSAALVLLGLAIFWLVTARPALARQAAPLDAPWAVIAGVALVAFVALGAYLAVAARPFVEASGVHPGQGGGDGIQLDFAAPFGSTPFAMAMRLAELGALAALLVSAARFLGRRDDRDQFWLGLVAAAGAMALAGNSLAGHAAARGGILFAAIDWVHLAAVAAWLGTLPGLLLLARRSHQPAMDRRRLLGDALRRHSRVALAAAPIVALTGIANSPLVLGDARGLVASTYGNVLLAKVALFSIALAIGAANFFLVRGRAFRRTIPLIGFELIVAALAVLGAANLVTTEPAAARLPVLTRTAIGTLHLYGEAGASTVHVAVILPAPGEQRYEVSVADLATGDYRTDVQKVFLVFGAPRESGLPEQRIELTAGATPWLWGTDGDYTPIVGEWTLEVLVRRIGERDESATFDLPVSEPLPPAVVPPPDTGVGVPLPLAWIWITLPAGAAGWLVPIGLLVAVIVVAALDRGGRSPLLRGARVALVALVVVSGVGVESRGVVEAANRAPAGAAAEANPVAPSVASSARGRNLYLANCAACHGTSGAGDGVAAAGFVPGPGELASSVPRLTDGELAYLIASGTVATRMPAFSITLSEHDRWDLVNYLRSAWHGSTP
jgi:copper transport protein